MFQPRFILCPTDFSECSSAALAIGIDLARQNDARILLLHVADTLGPEKVTFGEAASKLQPESHIKDLEQKLRSMVPVQPGLALQYLLAEGDPAAVIQNVARDRGCDLIVIGTHGRTGLEHILMGSIAEKVVRLSPCPVLVVKYPKPCRPA